MGGVALQRHNSGCENEKTDDEIDGYAQKLLDVLALARILSFFEKQNGWRFLCRRLCDPSYSDYLRDTLLSENSYDKGLNF